MSKANLTLLILFLIFLLGFLFIFIFPTMSEIIELYISPGVGLKYAAVISFFITTGLLVVMALVAGDGLLGEVQFLIGSFFTLFFFFWIMVAWIF